MNFLLPANLVFQWDYKGSEAIRLRSTCIFTAGIFVLKKCEHGDSVPVATAFVKDCISLAAPKNYLRDEPQIFLLGFQFLSVSLPKVHRSRK